MRRKRLERSPRATPARCACTGHPAAQRALPCQSAGAASAASPGCGAHAVPKPHERKGKASQRSPSGNPTLARRSRKHGGIPERPKGSDCKSDGNAFAGSNPALPTIPVLPALVFTGKNKTCGCGSMVERQPSKLNAWVRFPSPAPPSSAVFQPNGSPSLKQRSQAMARSWVGVRVAAAVAQW